MKMKKVAIQILVFLVKIGYVFMSTIVILETVNSVYVFHVVL
jgi:hypothetical protein